MHLRCGVCDGPEHWCLDASGDVWVRCMDDSCSSRTNLDLWPEEPIWPERGTVGDGARAERIVYEPDSSETLAEIRSADPSF